MRVFLLLLILLNFIINCAAQEKACRLESADAPTLFGLRLEMTPTQVKSIFGKDLKLKIKREGSFFQNFIEKEPPRFLPGVRALYLRFFDTKLYQIEIFYEPENKRRTLEEFLSQLSAELNLPPNLWVTKYGISELKCADFSLVADNVLNPRVELTDESIRARFEAAQKNKNK
ncbi:MAG: hypothetical protein H0W58_13630 [Acidobacteria bacterium]|nr:hypothetical protein [Acidobacteriota bacterium]